MLFQKLIKTEQTTEKLPNFQQIVLHIEKSYSQNFSVVASFIFELFGFLLYIYILYFYALFQKLIKTEQTIEKLLNFQQILLNFQTSFSQNFNIVTSFIPELLGFVFYIYTII